MGDELKRGVTDDDRKAEGQIEHAALAAVFETGAGEANLEVISKHVREQWRSLQTFVFLKRLFLSAAQRNTVKGRVQILHSMPVTEVSIVYRYFSILSVQTHHDSL